MAQRRQATTIDDDPNDLRRTGYGVYPANEEASEPPSDSEEMSYNQFVLAKQRSQSGMRPQPNSHANTIDKSNRQPYTQTHASYDKQRNEPLRPLGSNRSQRTLPGPVRHQSLKRIETPIHAPYGDDSISTPIQIDQYDDQKKSRYNSYAEADANNSMIAMVPKSGRKVKTVLTIDQVSARLSKGVQSLYNKYKSRTMVKFDDSDSNDDGLAEPNAQAESASKLNLLKNVTDELEEQLQMAKKATEVEKQKIQLGANSDAEIKPNPRFRYFSDLFSGLTKSKNVVTLYPIVSCNITYNSKLVIIVSKKDDRVSFIKMYSLANYSLVFEEKLGGEPKSYIKCKEVEQNNRGDFFCCVFIDDGNFKLRTFSDQKRKEEEIFENELDINKKLGLDNHTMPIDNFPDPFITCCFINDTFIFVNLYHSPSTTHHSFIYNYKTYQISSHLQVKMTTNKLNFPYKCFYSSEENEIFSFYRQGDAFRFPVFEIESTQNEKKEKYVQQKMIDKDLGQMFLIHERALVVRSSSDILFFKQQIDEFTKIKSWILFKCLHHRGFIFFIKGNKRIQITTDKKIYIYLIDPRTFEPTLENVINNFMDCTQMMFGSKVRNGITFKTNQKSFDIWKRTYNHSFNSNVVEAPMDGSIGLPIETMNAFLVGRDDKIQFFDIDTFQEKKQCQINIPLLKSTTREPNEIIALQKSQDETVLAVISGKNLCMNEQQTNQLFIFVRIDGGSDMDYFQLDKRIKLAGIEGFNNFSMQFHFKLNKKDDRKNWLIFAKQDKIFEFDYESQQLKDTCVFENPLLRQPAFFLMNKDQTVSLIASQDDGLYYNHRTQQFVDLDHAFDVKMICQIIHDEDDNTFYMLVNKYQEKLGIYLIKFSDQHPEDFKFFLKYNNKLDIGNADIALIKNEEKGFKELLVSYKTIHMNTYTVQVIDISTSDQWTVFKHLNFQLWESKIAGFYVKKNKDFININIQGINVVALGNNHRRAIAGQDNSTCSMLHSLESVNYLKIDSKNFIEFEFSTEDKFIKIVQQFTKKGKNSNVEHDYTNVFNIKIHEITLRELLLFQSLFVCSTQSDILELVMDQPKPEVFLKSFLEFDGANMVSILSFDSRSMSYLLSDRFADLFQEEFPIFYRNKIQKANNKRKFFFRSAIDVALKNNQIRAAQSIITYIKNYQNNFISSYLFKKNMPLLVDKGVTVSPLLESKVFSFNFDFDEWPSTHPNPTEEARAYNQSIFNIRYYYKDVFPETSFEAPEVSVKLEETDSTKMYKIQYRINILPMIDEHVVEDQHGNKEIMNQGYSFFETCIESDELDIFDGQNFQELLLFKWTNYAKQRHLVGFTIHCIYVAILVTYTYCIYILDIESEQEDKPIRKTLELALIIPIFYPTAYESTQCWKMGLRNYLSDLGNYLDIIYLTSGISNTLLQNSFNSQSFQCKFVMTMIFLMQIHKTFFFLKIFDPVSYIVTMLYTVLADLKVFMLFYFIMIFLFSQIFSVIGLANPDIQNYPGVRENNFMEFYNYGNNIEDLDPPDKFEGPEEMPGEEYQYLNLFVGNFINVLRTSLGDFDFGASEYLTPSENILFWIIWFFIVVLTCIVFLNFIIAEASASYEKIKSRLDAEIFKAKADLITEAENMTFERYKTKEMLPKYIIIRQIET